MTADAGAVSVDPDIFGLIDVKFVNQQDNRAEQNDVCRRRCCQARFDQPVHAVLALKITVNFIAGHGERDALFRFLAVLVIGNF